jgi:erythromycin esterase
MKSSSLFESSGERKISVVHNPHYEKDANYVETTLPVRYDAVLLIDVTHALHPLHIQVSPDKELAETFPTGL